MRRPSRLSALLLLIIFITGGLGAAQADAVLFHSLAQESHPAGAHVDLPDGCGTHAESCVLAIAASPPQLAALGASKVRIDQGQSRSPVLTTAGLLPSADRKFLHPSRAPPIPAH
jgi:hypothetical protein